MTAKELMDRFRKLIERLLSDSEKFESDGAAYELLQCYFDGAPIKSLVPLLRRNEPEIVQAAVWIASELGGQASSLVPDVVPLTNSPNRYVRYHALEILAAAARDNNSRHLARLVEELKGGDSVTRILSMKLLARLESQRLRQAAELAAPHSEAARGLSYLAEADALSEEDISMALKNEDSLWRKFAGIASYRVDTQSCTVLDQALQNKDPDVQRFAEQMREWINA